MENKTDVENTSNGKMKLLWKWKILLLIADLQTLCLSLLETETDIFMTILYKDNALFKLTQVFLRYNPHELYYGAWLF